MTIDELKLRRLSGQDLFTPTASHTVIRDLCGLQAQFLSHAFHALSIRSTDFDAEHPEGFMKNWTLRGTMHLFSECDLPLMLHKKRTHNLRPCDTLGEDEWISAERKQYFAELIMNSVHAGTSEREALKQICFDAGMSDKEAQSVFNSWGGTIRALCEAGRLSHAVSKKKAFIPCPAFEPMEKEKAELELAHRYFTHYGPATVRDAAYFFGSRQAEVRRWLAQMPVEKTLCEGKTYYYIDDGLPVADRIPPCIFLAGFDPLLLGYEKTENPFLPPEHLRGIFNLAGVVMPGILLNGRVVGKWKKTGNKLTITLFETLEQREKATIYAEMERMWKEIRRVDGLN